MSIFTKNDENWSSDDFSKAWSSVTQRVKDVAAAQRQQQKAKQAQQAAPKPSKTYTVTTTKGKQYSFDDDAYKWITSRYLKDNEDSYGLDDADQYAKRTGQMSASMRKSYKNSTVDQKLAEMGLPSEKNFEKYLGEYDKWHTGGMDQVFGNTVSSEQWSKMQEMYKRDWSYEDTIEDQTRKAMGLVPTKLLAEYADTELDDSLKARGLPPSASLSKYNDQYNNYKGIDTLYRNAAGAITSLRVTPTDDGKYITNDDQRYTFNGQTMTGKQWYAKAFFDELERTDEKGNQVYASLMPLFKNSNGIVGGDAGIDPTGDYANERGKIITAYAKNAGNSADYDSYNAFSYDDFAGKYGDYYDQYFKNVKDNNGQTVGGFLDVKAREADAEREKAFYTVEDKWFDGDKGIDAFVSRYMADYPTNTPEQMFTDMLEHGVSEKTVKKAMRALANSAKENRSEDGTSGFYDIKDAYAKAKSNYDAKNKKVDDGHTEELDMLYGPNGYDVVDGKVIPKAVEEPDAKAKYNAADKSRKEYVKTALKEAEDDQATIDATANAIQNALSGVTATDVDTVLDVIKSVEKQDFTNPVAVQLALEDLGFIGNLSGFADDLTDGWSQEDKNKLAFYLGGAQLTGIETDDYFNHFNRAEGDSLGDTWADYGYVQDRRKLKRDNFAYNLEWAQEQIANGASEGFVYNVLAGAGFQEELEAYMPEEWRKAIYMDVTVPRMYEQAGGDNLAAWELMSPAERKATAERMWNDMSAEEKAQKYQNADWWKYDPDVYRTTGQAFEQQLTAVLPEFINNTVTSGVQLADSIGALISGRPEMGETTQDLMKVQQGLAQFGKVYDGTNGAEIADMAGTAAGELLRMYTLGAVGSIAGEAFGATKLGTALANAAKNGGSKAIRKGAELFMSMSTTSPFILSSYAGNYAEAKALGASNGEAAWYGLVNGLTEGIVEGLNVDQVWGKAFGSEKLGKQILDGVKAVRGMGPVAKARVLSAVVGFLGEATEEGMGYVVETLSKMRYADTWGKGTQWSWEDAKDAMLMGGITGALGAGISSGSITAGKLLVDYALSDSAAFNQVFPELAESIATAESLPKSTLEMYEKGGASMMSQEAYKFNEGKIEECNDGIESAGKTRDAAKVNAKNELDSALLEIDKVRSKLLGVDVQNADSVHEFMDLCNRLGIKIDLNQPIAQQAATALDARVKSLNDAYNTAIERADTTYENDKRQKEELRAGYEKKRQEHFVGLYLANRDGIIAEMPDELIKNVAKTYQEGGKYDPAAVAENGDTVVAWQKADANTGTPLENVNDPASPWWSKQKEADAKPARPFSAEDEQAVMEAASQMRYKGEISFVNEPDANWEGKINVETGDITINRTALTSRDAQHIQENPAMWVLEHELWHYVWNRGGSMADELASTVRKMYEQHPGIARGDTEANWNRLLDGVIQKRNSQGLNIQTREQAAEEVVGDFFRNYAFRSEAAIKALCQTNGNLGERILSWLRYKIDDMKLRRSKDSWARDLLKVERQYALALREAGRNPYNATRAQASNDVSYSVKRTTDNKPFIEIEEDILAGVPKSQWKKTVFEYIRNRFKGGFDANGQHIDVTRKSANEILRSKNSQWLEKNDDAVYADKLRASAYLDEITAASPDYVNESPNHDRDDNITSFGRGNIRFRFGTNDYIAEVLIGNRDDGSLVFHDVVSVSPTSFTEKEMKQPSMLGDVSAATNSLRTASIDTVPSVSESVKTVEKESASGNTTDDLLNSYVGVANPRTGVTAEEDEAYMRAALAGDTETAGRMVREMYERNGWLHGYHGDDDSRGPVGRYTVIDWNDFRNKQMFLAQDDEFVASAYTSDGNDNVRPISYGPGEIDMLNQYVGAINDEIGSNYEVDFWYTDADGNRLTEAEVEAADASDVTPNYGLVDLDDEDTGYVFVEHAPSILANDLRNATIAQGTYGVDNPLSGGVYDLYVSGDRPARYTRGYNRAWNEIPGIGSIPESYRYDTITVHKDPVTNEKTVEATKADGTIITEDVQPGEKVSDVFDRIFGEGQDVYDEFAADANFENEDTDLIAHDIAVDPDTHRVFSPSGELRVTDNVGKADRRAGYDLSVITNIFDGADYPTNVIIARNENRIKSADAITYDNKGNIIPLSQRGDTSVNELRYSGDLDVDQLLNDLVEEYGAIEPGREPRARDVQVPKQSADNMRVSKFTRSLDESSKITDAQSAEIESEIGSEADRIKQLWSYIPKTNDETMAWARQYITARQPLAAQQEFHDRVAGGQLGLKTEALGLQLLSDAAERGDWASVKSVAVDLRVCATEAGQSAQIFNVLKDLKGVGSAWYVDALVRKLNSTYADAIQSGQMDTITVSDEAMDKVRQAKTAKEIEAAEDAVAEEIAKQLPLKFTDKMSSWRYLSMLGNPTTHVRNTVGNVLMAGLNSAKDIVATGLENILNIDQSERAHAVLTAQDRSTWGNFAQASFEEQQRNLQGGGKLGFETFVKQHMRDFDAKWLNAISKFNFNLLEGEDLLFIRPAYKNALMEYMKAQGYALNAKGEAGKVNGKTGEFTAMTNEQMNKAVEWASNQAWKATFRDASSLATMLNKISKENAVSKLLVEGVMPFKKTPINIAKRGVEYSPAGIIMGIAQLTNGVKKGKVTAAQAIDNLASGITGTALMALGVFLAKAGVIRAGGEDKKRYETYLEDTGDQTYAMKFGNKSINMSAIAPATIPLFMGVALQEMVSRKNDGEGVDLSTITDTIAGTLNPFMEMSFMSSLNSALKNYNNDGIGGALGSTLLTAAENYGSQYLPTFTGKIGQFLDPTVRTTKSDATSPIGGNLDYYVRSLAKKIPGLEATLQPDVDVWGRTTTKDTFSEWAWDFANKFILPTNVKVTNRDAVDNELIRIVESTGNVDFLPSDGAKYFTVKGQKYTMDARQYKEYSQDRGQAAYVALKDVMASPAYQAATDDGKYTMLKKSIDAAYKQVNNLWKEKLGALG